MSKSPGFEAKLAEARPTFEDFFGTEHARLFGALCFVTGDRDEAEEIMQDAFLRLWERWDQLRLDDASAYLFRTAMNVFRNRYRRTAHSLRKTLAIAPSDDAFETVDDRDLVVRTLRDLTADQRAAVLLTGYVGLTSEEAGQMLGMRPSTVRTLATRARAAIRERVGEDPMIDERQVFERVMRGFVPPDDSLERFRRRDRKRRNQRIAAGVVGIAAFVAAVWIATSVASLDRSEKSVVPAGTGPVQTGPVETGPTETRPVAETGPTETGPAESAPVPALASGAPHVVRQGRCSDAAKSQLALTDLGRRILVRFELHRSPVGTPGGSRSITAGASWVPTLFWPSQASGSRATAVTSRSSCLPQTGFILGRAEDSDVLPTGSRRGPRICRRISSAGCGPESGDRPCRRPGSNRIIDRRQAVAASPSSPSRRQPGARAARRAGGLRLPSTLPLLCVHNRPLKCSCSTMEMPLRGVPADRGAHVQSEPRTFEAFYWSVHRPLFGALRVITGNRTDAEDISQRRSSVSGSAGNGWH